MRFDWSKDEWDNLDQQAAKLVRLLETRERDKDNPAWQTKLRLTLQTLRDYDDAMRLLSGE
jgi:hypothetical protein